MAKKNTTSTKEVQPYAYTIKDNSFGKLQVKNSANAWWIDVGKVERLIEAFKYDATIEEAIIQAGISYEQFRYFREVHPEFSQIEARLRELPSMVARMTVVSNLPTDSNLSFKYLERKKPLEFGPRDKSPIVVIPISMRGVAKDYQPDGTKIQEIHRGELSD